MRYTFDKAEIRFRDEVRAFLKDHLTEELRRRVRERAWLHLPKDDYVGWARILHARGWAAPNWPKEHGGPGWSAAQQYIFDEELALADAPTLLPFGIYMVGPVLQAFGTEEQKRRWLPRIPALDDWWCQGYSEPGSGSDLASLRTRAVRDGAVYRVTGQKIWTTLGHFANMMFCLARTDPEAKPQEGISFLLLDMTKPGVSVKPIVTFDGCHSVNSVFLDQVEVPVENLVGREGQGWTIAKYLLGHERTKTANIGPAKRRLALLKEIVAKEGLESDAAFAEKIAAVEAELRGHELTALRVLADQAKGKPPGAEASLLKLRGTEIMQKLTLLAVEALGPLAAPYEFAVPGSNEAPVVPEHGIGVMENMLGFRAATIYGGSNEIQRNIIAKMVLGL
jgi:alkylation response protein AidB-like acyl-CoA dehydrogenase